MAKNKFIAVYESLYQPHKLLIWTICCSVFIMSTLLLLLITILTPLYTYAGPSCHMVLNANNHIIELKTAPPISPLELSSQLTGQIRSKIAPLNPNELTDPSQIAASIDQFNYRVSYLQKLLPTVAERSHQDSSGEIIKHESERQKTQFALFFKSESVKETSETTNLWNTRMGADSINGGDVFKAKFISNTDEALSFIEKIKDDMSTRREQAIQLGLDFETRSHINVILENLKKELTNQVFTKDVLDEIVSLAQECRIIADWIFQHLTEASDSAAFAHIAREKVILYRAYLGWLQNTRIDLDEYAVVRRNSIGKTYAYNIYARSNSPGTFSDNPFGWSSERKPDTNYAVHTMGSHTITFESEPYQTQKPRKKISHLLNINKKYVWGNEVAQLFLLQVGFHDAMRKRYGVDISLNEGANRFPVNVAPTVLSLWQ